MTFESLCVTFTFELACAVKDQVELILQQSLEEVEIPEAESDLKAWLKKSGWIYRDVAGWFHPSLQQTSGLTDKQKIVLTRLDPNGMKARKWEIACREQPSVAKATFYQCKKLFLTEAIKRVVEVEKTYYPI